MLIVWYSFLICTLFPICFWYFILNLKHIIPSINIHCMLQTIIYKFSWYHYFTWNRINFLTLLPSLCLVVPDCMKYVFSKLVVWMWTRQGTHTAFDWWDQYVTPSLHSFLFFCFSVPMICQRNRLICIELLMVYLIASSYRLMFVYSSVSYKLVFRYRGLSILRIFLFLVARLLGVDVYFLLHHMSSRLPFTGVLIDH